MKVWTAVSLFALTAVSPAIGQAVIDGDTLELDGTLYRLWGINAPEMKQDCPDGWPAGRLADVTLQTLMQGRRCSVSRRISAAT